MSGRGKNQVQETPAQRAQMEFAQKQVKSYQERWLPLQMNLAQSIDEMGADGSARREQAKGIATTETEARFSRAADQLETGLGQTGQLGSSKGKMAIAGLGEDQATSRAMGLTQAEQDIDNAYAAGLTSLMKIGQGDKATASAGINRTAAISSQRAAADADAALSHRMGNAQLAGQVGGLGLAYAGRPPARGIGTTNDFSGIDSQSSAMDTFFARGTTGD